MAKSEDVVKRSPIDATAAWVVSKGTSFDKQFKEGQESESEVPFPTRQVPDGVEDLTGMTSGLLTVIGLLQLKHPLGHRRANWVCRWTLASAQASAGMRCSQTLVCNLMSGANWRGSKSGTQTRSGEMIEKTLYGDVQVAEFFDNEGECVRIQLWDEGRLSIDECMINREQTIALIARLQYWVDTGSLHFGEAGK